MACDYCYVCIVLFFFFKQKTAYELRISDWSSDVCSSDLAVQRFADDRIGRGSYHRGEMRRLDFGGVAGADVQQHVNGPAQLSFCVEQRSEEHTSELQSLMRISYAVFCLKKTKKDNNN